MKTLKCYTGFSEIPEFYKHGSTGGVTTTLAYGAILKGDISGVLVCDQEGTFIAKTKEDLIRSCGSIYEEFKYEKSDGENLGQVGKSCNIDKKYDLILSIFCSHTSHKQEFTINKDNRDKVSRIHTPLKCWFCRDHVGIDADINIGDTQHDPKCNVIISRTKRGQELIKYCINEELLNLEPIILSDIVSKQPYLWRWWRK